jgi:hypothetical protein
MAGATTMLYYSRHLLPYDTSMALALAALWCGVGQGSRIRSVACGALSAFAFLTYNAWVGWRGWFPSSRQQLAAVVLILVMAILNLSAWTQVVLPPYV